MRAKLFKNIIFFAFISLCLAEGKVDKDYVHVSKASKDGFEIVALKNNIPISIKYSNYSSKFNYIIKNGKVAEIVKKLNESTTNRYFITLKVDNLGTLKQEICLAYHYSKSQYKYCYLVFKKSVIPLYSEYHDLSTHKKRGYYLNKDYK